MYNLTRAEELFRASMRAWSGEVFQRELGRSTYQVEVDTIENTGPHEIECHVGFVDQV